MGYHETGRWCPYCKQFVLGKREEPNHLLHAIITIFTCLFWGLVWVLLTTGASSNPYKCPKCGADTVRPEEAPAQPPA